MERQSLKKRILFFLATKLGWLLIYVLARLTQVEYIGKEHFLKLKESGKPFLICVWHGRMLLPIYLLRKLDIHTIVSEHQDGEIIAQTIQRFGFTPIRGSSTRGGRKAALGLIRALRQQQIGCIIPDGPRGPRHEFKNGPIFIAQKTGAYLLPLTFASDKYIEFRSWDRFLMWKPFSRCIAMYAEPIEIPPTSSESEMEKLRMEVQQVMVRQVHEADAYFRE